MRTYSSTRFLYSSAEFLPNNTQKFRGEFYDYVLLYFFFFYCVLSYGYLDYILLRITFMIFST